MATTAAVPAKVAALIAERMSAGEVTLQGETFAEEIGEVSRRGRTIFYAFVNGIRTERDDRAELVEYMAAVVANGGTVGVTVYPRPGTQEIATVCADVAQARRIAEGR